jgi:hypothetical protein
VLVSVAAVVDIARGAPSREAWRRLVAALEAIPEDELAGTVYRLEPELNLWPERLRVRPRRWGLRVAQAGSSSRVSIVSPLHEAWSLGRTLHLGDILDARTAELLSGWEGLRHTTGLTCEGSAPNAALSALFAGSWREDLRWLGLRESDLLEAGIGWMADHQWPALERLDLAQSQIQDDALLAIANHAFPQLRRLNLAGHRRGPHIAEAVLASPAFAFLERVNLTGAPFGEAAAQAWVKTPDRQQLDRITLGSFSPDDAAVSIDALVDALESGKVKLSRLTLRRVVLELRDAERLQRAAAGCVEELVLRDCSLPDSLKRKWVRTDSAGPRIRLR